MIDKELLDILACPACKADVVLETAGGQEKIVCTKCYSYLIREDCNCKCESS